MTTGFTTNSGQAQLTVYFKIMESQSSISISFKHWVTENTSCKIQLSINNATTLTRYVDLAEAGSGVENVSTLSLRYKDFGSIDYCDYLQYGLNQIVVTITPVDSNTTYSLLALSVG